MRKIGVITTSRADYGIWRPVLRALQAREDVSLGLYVTGTHLVPSHGKTISQIEADGFAITARVEGLLASDTPQGVAKSIGVTCASFAQVFASNPPDLLLVLGDRYEMFAACLAALPFNIPMAHVHGGEVTEGAIDESLRHAMTKMCHLHFAATPRYAARIAQLGEEPWRIQVSGAPALDHLADQALATREEIEAYLDCPLPSSPLVVTYHPVTKATEEESARDARAFVKGLSFWDGPIVITQTNADTFSGVVAETIQTFANATDGVHMVGSLGIRRYFGLLSIASAMAGNSSSGIIEAASFGLPVVNVGPRQRGRDCGANVIHVEPVAARIEEALTRATSAAFRESLATLENPYFQGGAADKIASRVALEPLGERLLMKRFFDIEHEAISS